MKIRVPGPPCGDGEGDAVTGRADSPGHEVEAVAPLIISASRSTDIPAFYGDWFMERLRRGYAKWVNPWNGAPVYVSLKDARVFVFWSKNPAPFVPRLEEMTRRNIQYLMLFTLNDYEAEGLEPRLPPLEERLQTFKALSRMAGRGRVVWRWDPLLLSGSLGMEELLDRIRTVGDAISPFTDQMIFSFIDIARYPKVAQSLRIRGFGDVREFSPAEELELAAGLHELNRSWGLTLSACGEERDFSAFGIGAGGCISRDLMLREFGEDQVLRQFLEGPDPGSNPLGGTGSSLPPHLKDPGQRPACNCVVSKDIGQYSTCPHLCAYCYANTTPARVEVRYSAYRVKSEKGIFGDSITGESEK